MFDGNYNFEKEVVDLWNPDEFITRIQGTESGCITKLVFTTNLGQKKEVGNDYYNDMEEQSNEKSRQQPRYFEAELPAGAQVVCVSGVIGARKLKSLMAYYS